MPIHYRISYENPSTQYIHMQMTLETAGADATFIRMSAWRPGRYELGNFTKNIRFISVSDENGNRVSCEKVERERWKVNSKGTNSLTIRYELFAGLLNAGSTYLDASQLYMNPVNSFLYIEGKEQEECFLEFLLPDDYTIACGMESTGRHQLRARNFDQLADCPLIASNSLKHLEFQVLDLMVHCWFQGECKPDMERVKNDFTRFIEEQINAFGGFPEKEYHFLFLITPHKSHHGVEHENSTVCMIGPTYSLMGSAYDEFVELSSHEFYHSWNIKKIRPVEMMPYDFTKENFFRTGYVAEGVTTYYGDAMLYRARVLSQSQYFVTLKDTLQKHYHNYARLNMPVSEASFDAWVDGYEAGVPHRKTSIYTEGALWAMLIDILIIHHSERKYSLDDVMKSLYTDFALQGKGYTSDDYRELIEKYSGISFIDFFDKYIFGCDASESIVHSVMRLVGLEMRINPSNELYERNFGLKLSEESGKVLGIAPGSPADKSGVMIGDIIASINGFTLNGNAKSWFNYFQQEEVQLRLRTVDGRNRQANIIPSNGNYYPDYSFIFSADATDEQKKTYERWTKNTWGIPVPVARVD